MVHILYNTMPAGAPTINSCYTQYFICILKELMLDVSAIFAFLKTLKTQNSPLLLLTDLPRLVEMSPNQGVAHMILKCGGNSSYTYSI